MNKRFQRIVSIFLLSTYMPVALAIGLLHTDPPLPGSSAKLPSSFIATGSNTVTHSYDGYCAACNFTSRHFYDEPIDISLPFKNIQIIASVAVYEFHQPHIVHFSKRAPPVLSFS